MDSRTVGVLGAGQLGRMFVEAASRLNVKVLLLDAGTTAPAKQISFQPSDPSSSTSASQHVDGSFSDATKIGELARAVDVLTIEIEHVDAAQLQRVLDDRLVQAVHPLPATIATIQDKYQQKLHLQAHGVPVADFLPIDAEGSAPAALEESVAAAARAFGFPLMLKSRTHAYDGKGNAVVRSASDVARAVSALGGGQRALYAERWAPFVKEVAVMVVRSAAGEVRSYPAVETVHKDSICHTVFAPLRHASAPGAAGEKDVAERAREIAERAVATFGGAGVFGVEMFLMGDGQLVLNEIAPRPHNSGHYTIEACETSQYENHLRAILGLPLGSTALKVPAAAMLNLLGLADLDTDKDALRKTYLPAHVSLRVPGATAHLYGKAGCRRGRKMGHITLVGPSDADVAARLKPLQQALDYATLLADNNEPLPAGAEADAARFAVPGAALAAGAKQPGGLDFSHPHPLVGIIMGSDSDLPVMLAGAEILKRFAVPFELSIVSAHRTPERMRAYARTAAQRGVRAIIAGAGGAAHLPGMVAAQTPLPVIGVPVKGSSLDGVDSLHSIVQMPRGIPVATVAINNSVNAALLAVRMLGAGGDARLLAAMQAYMDDMEAEVLGKVERLQQMGWEYTGKK